MHVLPKASDIGQLVNPPPPSSMVLSPSICALFKQTQDTCFCVLHKNHIEETKRYYRIR